MAGDPEGPVAMAQVAVHPPLASRVVPIVGVGQGRALERAELGLDEVEPARIGRGEHRSDPQPAQQRQEARAVVDVAEVVEDDVQPPAGIAGPESAEGLGHLNHPLAPAEDPPERVGVDVIEGQERPGSAAAVVRRPDPGGCVRLRPDDPALGPQLERSELVEADHPGPRRALGIEPPDGPLFSSNRGSLEVFQVLTRWAVRPSRRNSRRTHSSLIAGRIFRFRQYAASLATDQALYGRPRSAGLESATSTSSFQSRLAIVILSRA